MVYQMYRLQKERRKMISFVECSMAMQDFLMILLEICMILELICLLYTSEILKSSGNMKPDQKGDMLFKAHQEELIRRCV